LARDGIAAGGFDELGLLSLSTGDYGCLPELMGTLMDTFAAQKVSVSMPSMRVGTLTKEIMTQIQRVRKTGFTVAPEAGTDRLRLVINKGITEEDLLATCEAAFNMGWKLIKFYFMIGLPTETYEDVEAIVPLVRRALQKAGRKGCSITVSVSLFVPKPHTPFQWEPQISIDEAFARINLLKKRLPRKGFKLKWHDPYQSFLEGVFSRGDRRLSAVIEKAWRAGVRLDGWSEHFVLDTWRQAGRDCGIELESYLDRREHGQVLPWQHLDTGVEETFIESELAKAYKGEYTPDCRVHGCQKCGVCDFKEVLPHVHSPTVETIRKPSSEAVEGDLKQDESQQLSFLYRIAYSRLGDVRFLGHLELIQVFFRALSRAKAELKFSQGFNPSPKVSFSPALPVGTESLAEYLDVELLKPLSDLQAFLDRFNLQLPAGLRAENISLHVDRDSPVMLFGYEITMPRPFTEEEKEGIGFFAERQQFIISRIRKGRKREYDVRPQVKEFKVIGDDAKVQLALLHESGKATPKPLELLQAVLGISDDEVLRARVVKISREDAT
jgi:radical SAM-linked protein